ncbi:accessory Sec system protein Asp2 [Bacillus weihaiensis]|uniref:accessory Sec system protein Asp2 n=1 Tax=Bacillus weihaiensis TaxID=1547283 RepID=UPI0023521B64|nr:accessory Sec system protein Asp2 [Bacillus weihaiensis]
MFKFEEKTFESNLPVKYVFEEGVHNKDYLVVVFSGFNSVKSKTPYNYNYIRTLRTIDCNRLFILDNYGPRGSYYLGENLSFDFEEAVFSLITTIAENKNVKKDKVITAGSSKGGSAALYFGLKYNFGNVIAGAPQTKIADYVNQYSKETLNYILGGNVSETRISQLNQLIFNELETENSPILRILTSENDDQYKHHIVPFEDNLKNTDINYYLDVNNDILSHNDIAVHFPLYLIKQLLYIMYDIDLKKFNINQESVKEWEIEIVPEEGNIVHSSLEVKDSEKSLSQIPISSSLLFDKTSLQIKGFNILNLEVSITKNGENILSYPLETILSFDGLVLMGTDLRVEEDALVFELLMDEHPKLEYAFYVRKNNVVIDKIMYQKSKKLVYPINGHGTYQIHYFIKYKKEKYSNRSKSINVK